MMMRLGRRREGSLSRIERSAVTGILLLASVFPVELFPNTAPLPKGSDGQYSGKQGQIIIVRVSDIKAATKVQGRFLGRTLPLFPNPDGGADLAYLGLLGIDMQDEPGTHELTVEIQMAEQISRRSVNVLV